MTDLLTGKADAKRLFAYVESLTREARKALTLVFNQQHKGLEFSQVPSALNQSLIDWFSGRDKNIKLSHKATIEARDGQVRMVFIGQVKSIRFKMHLDAQFASSGQSPESPSYLRQLNVSIDDRDFSA